MRGCSSDDVGDLDAADEQRQEPQPRGQPVGRERRFARAVLAQHHVGETHGAGREQRDGDVAAQGQVEAGDVADLGLGGFAHAVGRDQQRHRGCATSLNDTKTALARAWLQLIFLAYQACEMTHAIVVTIVRVAVTHRKMLEWQTAATSTRLTGSAARAGAWPFVEQMLASPLFATVALAAVALLRPRALPAASPILLLWMAAPLVAYALSQPVARRQPEIKPADRRFLRLIARKTWRYFDTFVGAVGPWVAAGQLSGGAAADGRAPHVAHQHRDEPARRRWPPTISASSGPTSSLKESTRRCRRSRAWSASRVTCSTGTTRRVWRR